MRGQILIQLYNQLAEVMNSLSEGNILRQEMKVVTSHYIMFGTKRDFNTKGISL